jgi:hypothetical protein
MTTPRFKCLRALQARFLLALVLIGILPLGLVGLGVTTMDRRAIAEQSARELTGLAQGLAGELDAHLGRLLSETRAIAVLPEVVSLDPTQQRDLSRELLQQHLMFARLSTFDLAGQQRASSHPGGDGRAPAGE